MSQSSITPRGVACIIVTCLATAGCREQPELPAGPRREIETWLADWETARACLLPSAYEDTPTTVAIMALSGTRPDCKTSIDALQVPAPRGGDALAVLWRDAITSAAAIDLHAPPALTASTIDHVDRSAAILRLARALPLVVRKYEKGPRRLGRGRTLMIGGAELTADVPLTLQRNAIAGRLASGAGIVDFFGTSLATVRAFPHAAGSAAVYPGGGAVEGRALGAIELDGVRLVIRAAPPGAAYAYAVEVTTKAGVRRHLVDRAHGELVGVSQTPLTGHLFVLMYEPGPSGGLRVHHYDPFSPWWAAALGKPAPARAPRPGPWTQGARIDCRVDRLGWSLAGDQLHLVNTERSLAIPLAPAAYAKERSIDCAGGAAIVLAHGPDNLELCEELEGCATVHRPKHGRRGVAAVLPDGGWIYATELEGVVGVWRGYLPVRFFRLAAPARLVGIVVLEHTEYLAVVEADRRYRFVPLPPTQI